MKAEKTLVRRWQCRKKDDKNWTGWRNIDECLVPEEVKKRLPLDSYCSVVSGDWTYRRWKGAK
jgi:hypothetical protein